MIIVLIFISGYFSRLFIMKVLVAFTIVVLAVNAVSEKSQWSSFKVKYEKSYNNIVEEKHRYSVFLNNLKKISEHNKKYESKEETYFLGINEFADLTEKEFSQWLGHHKQPELKGQVHEFSEDVNVPESIDWREKGAVLPIEDQGKCHLSSWTFSAVAAIEGQNYILYNQSISLSKQQILDCTLNAGHGNCSEFTPVIKAFEYVADYGLTSEEICPFLERDSLCKDDVVKMVVQPLGFRKFDPTEEDLKNAVGSIGPVSVTIYADPIQLYAGGIFDNSSCGNDINLINHAALAVGYGEEDGKPYWIIKNSWGKSWGEDGYLRLARNSERCGIALMATYPIL